MKQNRSVGGGKLADDTKNKHFIFTGNQAYTHL